MVMAILGHSQIALTMNTYSHYIPDEMGDQVAAQMNEIWKFCRSVGAVFDKVGPA
jgi:integrase